MDIDEQKVNLNDNSDMSGKWIKRLIKYVKELAGTVADLELDNWQPLKTGDSEESGLWKPTPLSAYQSGKI
jgi:hypothetical protein